MLRLYPAAFRDEYGREMSLVFVDRYRAAAGPMARATVWLDAITGIAIAAPAEQARAFARDIRQACRQLRRTPAFALVSIVTLALGLAAAAIMFAAIDAVVLKPLPFPDADRLVMVWTDAPGQRVREGRSQFVDVDEWRRRATTLAAVAAFDPVSVTLMGTQVTEQVSVLRASASLLPVLGITPLHGRGFSAREAEEQQRLVLISHGFWLSHFGGAPTAVGATLVLDGVPSRVIGILPPALAQAGIDTDLIEPLTLFPDWETRRGPAGPASWLVVGRLRPDTSLEQARDELDALAAARRPVLRGPAARVVTVAPLDEQVTDARSRRALWLLGAGAVLLLVAAAANVGGLALARGVGRLPQMSIRAALGAHPAALVRMQLAEALVLAVLAGLIGLLLAVAGVTAVRRLGPAELVRLAQAQVDVRVIVLTMGAALAAGVLVAAITSATVVRRGPLQGAAINNRAVAGRPGATRLRRILVVAQCATAIALLAGAGLLVRSWWNAVHTDAGFSHDRVLSVNLSTPAGMPPSSRPAFYERLIESTAALPGVERVGVSSELFVGTVPAGVVNAEGADPVSSQMPVRRDEVGGAFFETLGTPLVGGRLFQLGDGPDAPRVVVINQAMADRLWPGRDPIGRRLSFGPIGPNTVWFRVIGVVGDMRRQGPETAPVPQVFETLAQNPARRAILLVRTSTVAPLDLAPRIREVVQAIDRAALVYRVTTLEAQLDGYVAPRRMQSVLFAGVALVALLLATLGLYGVMQYSVQARTHELGIRRALGAPTANVVRLVVHEALRLAVAGLAVGLVVAWGLGRAVSGAFYGVTPADPATFFAVALLAGMTTMAACAVPAWRATRIRPGDALRHHVT
jgi:putative ABC transport system permease protein